MNIPPISLFGSSGTQSGSGTSSGTSTGTTTEPEDKTADTSGSAEGSSSGTTQSTGGSETASATQSVQPSTSTGDTALVVARPSEKAETASVVASVRFDAAPAPDADAELAAARQTALAQQERSAFESLIEAVASSSERAKEVTSPAEASQQYGAAAAQQVEPETPGVQITV